MCVLTNVLTPCDDSYMNTTTAQNANHRSDIAWIKSKACSFGAGYISEYLNPFTGQAIRKHCGMTGRDWHIFSAAGEVVAKSHSLTWAKMKAAA